MIGIIIILIWCFLVLISVIIGTKQNEIKSLKQMILNKDYEISRLRIDKNEIQYQLMISSKERFKNFDNIFYLLRDNIYLPKISIAENEPLNITNESINSAIELKINYMDFERIQLYRNGKMFWAWKRNGWLHIMDDFFKG